MRKSRVSKTAQVNLIMLSNLGIEEAVKFQSVFRFSNSALDILSLLPMSAKFPTCISLLSEILYKRTNELLAEADNPVILDLACGYSPRILKVSDSRHTYVGVDLPDVVADLENHFDELTKGVEGIQENYHIVDLTKYSEFQALMRRLNGPVTVITQGLLTYLTLEQKQVLMDNIKKLLKRNGGCWIIPDAAPDRLLPEIFEAVLGSGAYAIYKQMMSIVDAAVKRDRSLNGWFTTDEICAALEKNEFKVKRVPLYTDSLELRSLASVGPEAESQGLSPRLSPETAQEVIRNWKNTSSLVVTV